MRVACNERCGKIGKGKQTRAKRDWAPRATWYMTCAICDPEPSSITRITSPAWIPNKNGRVDPASGGTNMNRPFWPRYEYEMRKDSNTRHIQWSRKGKNSNNDLAVKKERNLGKKMKSNHKTRNAKQNGDKKKVRKRTLFFEEKKKRDKKKKLTHLRIETSQGGVCHTKPPYPQSIRNQKTLQNIRSLQQLCEHRRDKCCTIVAAALQVRDRQF